MTYRTLHNANETYKLAVLWLLIGGFLIAMALMFTHRTGAILVFFLVLLILAVAALIEKLVQWATCSCGWLPSEALVNWLCDVSTLSRRR